MKLGINIMRYKVKFSLQLILSDYEGEFVKTCSIFIKVRLCSPNYFEKIAQNYLIHFLRNRYKYFYLIIAAP